MSKSKKRKKKKYECPKCEKGTLYDDGGMFGAIIKCTNPDCDYTNMDGLIGCVGCE